MRIARNSALCLFAASLFLSSALLFKGGELLKTHSRALIRTQDHYVRGIKLDQRVSEPETEESAELHRLRDAAFFAKKIPEPPAVIKVKPSLGIEYQKLYFANVWDLLWYADFMGADSGFYNAVKAAIESGSFRESDDCPFRFQNCETLDKSIPLSAANAEKLFTLLKKKYVDKAIQAYADLAVVEARQLVVDGANLSRRFRIASDSELSTTRAYNAVVVPLAFMSKYSSTRSNPSAQDMQALFEIVDGGSVDENSIEDEEIKRYSRGLSLMRDGCFLDASQKFEESTSGASKGLLMELFSFLALRSVARPFLDAYKEGVVSSDDDKPDSIQVLDCDEHQDAAKYTSSFTRLEKKLGSYITHQGLLADLAYYRSKMPFPASAVSTLQANPSAGQSKGNAEPKTNDGYVKLPDGKRIAAANSPETLGDILAASRPESPKLAAGQQTVLPRSPGSTRRDQAGAAPGPSEDQSDEQNEVKQTETEARTRSDVNQDGQVVAVQRALNEHGRNQLKLTGKLDTETAEAIRRFERERKLPVTGQVSSRLMRELSITAGKSIKQVVPTAYESSAPKETSSKSDDAPPSDPEGTSLPTFRWPVRGKVIASYGSTATGKANEGINIAVPIDTPVKAAEDGVVAYSGNELKGYGLLVLVRHSNGYVTAYAHLSELLVKRGDTIKRGQVIAKSGSSGAVTLPQLHFELRKGSKPVDPLQFLNGA